MYPFAYVASATGRGGRWEGSFKALGDDLIASGFRRVLLMDRYAREDQVKYLQGRGLEVWGWDEPFPAPKPDTSMYNTAGPNQDRFVAMGYDGFVLQTETPAQRDLALTLFDKGFAVGKGKGIATYYYGFDDGHGPEYMDEFRAAGVTEVHVECYRADGHSDAAAYVARGMFLLDAKPGEVICLFGTYRNEIPSDYTYTADVGSRFGVYIVDGWPDDSTGDPDQKLWKAWGALNAVPTPEPKVTNDAAARNAQVADITQTWLNSFGPAPLSRMACEHDIAASTDEIWMARRADVRAALNGTLTVAERDGLVTRLQAVEAERDAALEKIEAAKTALS